MPQLDVASYAPQLFWLAVTFVLLYVLMARVALPRIGDVIEERRKRREDNLAKAESSQREAEQVSEAYEAALAQSRADAHARIAEATDAARKQAEAEVARFDAGLREKTEAAERAIAAAKETALADATGIAAEIAQLATDKVAGLSIDAATARDAAEAAMKARAQ